MLLLVCATAMELNVLGDRLRGTRGISTLVCGVGPVEATLNLTQYLYQQDTFKVSAVFNFGVGGAYPGSGLKLLDCCFADSEVLGDLAVCDGDDVVDLPHSLGLHRHFPLKNRLHLAARDFCRQKNYPFCHGPFVTVCCASGSAGRGLALKSQFAAICENMEGAALARVCRQFNLPFLEMRSISNRVENRDQAAWRLQEAADGAATVAEELALFLASKRAIVDQ